MIKKHLSHFGLILLIALFSTGCTSSDKKTEVKQQSTNTEQTQPEQAQENTATDRQLEIKSFFAPQTITDACTTGTFTFKVTNRNREDFTYESITDKLHAIQLIWLDENNKVSILGSSSDLSRVAKFQPITTGQTGSITLTLISTTNCNPSDKNRCNGFESFYPNGSVNLYARIVDANNAELARSEKITVNSQVWSDRDSGQAFTCGDAWVYPEE